jgi:APA family basic amino acid/polyamine antiporter
MATEDGWLPQSWAARNRFGTPYIFLTVFFLVGITPILTGMTLDYVAILGNTFGAIFGLFPVVALYNLANRKPDAYAQAPFKLPHWMMKLFPVLAVLIYGYGIYKSWPFIGTQGMTAFFVYSLVATAYALWRYPVVRIKTGNAQAG